MSIMRNKLFALSLLVLSAGFAGCSNDDEEDLIGNWIKRSDFEGVARSDAASFTIGNTAYICTGYDGKDRLNDLWKCDGSQWTQLASMPEAAAARSSATAIGIGDKGYVGLGYDGDDYLGDFWCYDPASNSWQRKADFGGGVRHSATGFSLGNLGYIGTGYNGNYLKDFYSYEPSSNSWTKINSPDGSKRQGASSFVIGNKAYIVGGVNNGTYVNDFFMYDPASGLWTEKRKIADVTDQTYDDDYAITRSYGVAFTVGLKAYYTCGESGSLRSDTWEYDPISDLWKEKTSFEGTTRTAPIAFTINGRRYVATGRSSSYRFDDMFELMPDDEYDQYD